MATAQKKDIRKLSKEELTKALETLGEKSFRAKQIYEWLWQKGATTFDEMTNLSKDLRKTLETHFTFNAVTEDMMQESEDGTIKVRYKLHDGAMIEGVLIPSYNRMTACVSSQVGCSLTCKFCATGFMERQRNLDSAEIYDQVSLLNKKSLEHYSMPLSNIVFMGMGEPLLNYKNVMEGIEKITSPEGLNMSTKRITVSTAGVAKMIYKLADDGVKFNLALSLHAANDEKRDRIMPINETNNLDTLVEALNYFDEKTKGEITFEYILFDGFNDSIEDAMELTALCKKLPVKVNIIEYNKVDGVTLKKAKNDKRDAFKNYLESHRVIAKVRRSRGKDIDAACGQLANKGQ
jgi:23S rRNA (adenine2503-C2)-methyltransferase